jgi:hypothetical protein
MSMSRPAGRTRIAPACRSCRVHEQRPISNELGRLPREPAGTARPADRGSADATCRRRFSRLLHSARRQTNTSTQPRPVLGRTFCYTKCSRQSSSASGVAAPGGAACLTRAPAGMARSGMRCAIRTFGRLRPDIPPIWASSSVSTRHACGPARPRRRRDSIGSNSRLPESIRRVPSGWSTRWRWWQATTGPVAKPPGSR